jgi:plasmid stabilization system protein ParE
MLSRAPDQLQAYPRMGERLDGFEPDEVRRLFVGDYELRYQVDGDTIHVLRIWHMLEDR